MAPVKRVVLKSAMSELGRAGGKKGGKARWAGVSKEERSELARKAAKARWAKKKKADA